MSGACVHFAELLALLTICTLIENIKEKLALKTVSCLKSFSKLMCVLQIDNQNSSWNNVDMLLFEPK